MVTIRYFAAVREIVGRESESIDAAALGPAPSVDAVWDLLEERHDGLAGLRSRVRVAVNRSFVSGEHTVEDGDEVALIPPVSGGAGAAGDGGASTTTWRRREGRFLVTRDPLQVDPVRAYVTREEAGAVVLFEGVVRDHTDDHAVEHLEYECYGEMAVEKLVETADEASERWPAVEAAIAHRWGRLEVGERAVVIAVSSPHRAEAFEACRFIIDRLKEVVPIWKKEVGPGGAEWVGWGP